MDIGELLTYKPEIAPKRPAPQEEKEEDENEYDDDPNDSYEKRAAKRRKRQKAEQRRREQERMAMLEAEAAQAMSAAAAAKSAAVGSADAGGFRPDSNLSAEERQRINGVLERAGAGANDDADDGDADNRAVLDEAEMKRLILAFEKKALKNQELRIKFSDEPQKFMTSEVELHDSIQALRSLATAPDLYPMLVELQCVPSFLGLLAHDNTDIAVAMVDLIQELTDIDTLTESEEGAVSLIDALVSNQISALLIQCLERLNDNVREESDGIHNILSIFENMVEFRPEICREASEAGLLAWLGKRLKVRVSFDNNKLYASEILSIFLQNEPVNRQKYGEMGSAIDSLLQQLAYYKRHNPASAEEQEMMENLFDCLCSLLLHNPNRDRFLRGEGLQLMNLMLREKKVSRNGALKVLNHALIGPEGRDNCAKFVDILGLRTIFPLFMKTPKKHKRKGVTAEEHEEHVISIVASLMKNCRGEQRQRLFAKFTEADHEKVERLMEMHFKYLDKVQASERRLRDEAKAAGDDADDEEELYLRRLDAGLFSLQLIDYILVEACASGASSVKQRVLQILSMRKASVTTIRNIVREYAGNLGEGASSSSSSSGGGGGGDAEGDHSEREQERQTILHLVNKF